MRFFTSAMVVAALSVPARADDKLTLRQVIDVAVRQSPDLERASLDAKAADAAVARAEGVEDTHLGFNVHAAKSRNAAVGSFTNDEATQLDGTASLTRVLPTGGSLGLTLGISYASDAPASGDPFVGFLSTATVDFNQPLLRGAGATGFEAPIRDARHTRDAATLAREAKARDLLVAIVEAYWQVALAKRQLEVRETSVGLATTQLESMKALLKVGKASESDEVAVRQALATRQQDVLAAEQEVNERSLALRQLAGLEITPTTIRIDTDALPDKAEGPAFDVARVLADAFDHSAELASLAAGTKAATAGLEGAESAAKSRLDLGLSGGPAGLDQDVIATADQGASHAKLSRTFSNLVKFDGYQVLGSLTFDRAIERRTEKGGVAAAHARFQRAKVDERAAKAQIAVAATRAVQRAMAATKTIELGEVAIKLADQGITNEKNKFDLGRSNIFEVLRRQDDLQLARLRQASAIVDYLNARAELDGLTGQILMRFGVTMH